MSLSYSVLTYPPVGPDAIAFFMLRSASVFLPPAVLASSAAGSCGVAFMASNSVSLRPAPPLSKRDCLALTCSELLLSTTSAVSFFAAFHAAMKDTALVVLNKSSEQVKAKQSRFDKGGAGLSDTEFEAMKATPQEPAADEAKTAGGKKTLADLNMKKAMASGPTGGYVSTLYDKDIAAAQANLAQIETQRKIHLAKYPLLSRIEPAEFLKLTTKEEMAGKLGGELPGILK